MRRTVAMSEMEPTTIATPPRESAPMSDTREMKREMKKALIRAV
jgi:hypothetical protein